MLNRLAKLREERDNGENGFTLIELLVVVVIIGILIAIAIPLYLNYTKGSKDKSADSDVRGAVSVLEQCNSDNGSYPAAVTVNATDATKYTSCTGQTINVSSGTTLTYTPSPATGTVTSYVIVGKNTTGTSQNYCYNSANGGSVKSVGTATTC